MDDIDALYRAIHDYRTVTEGQSDLTAFRRAVASSNAENDTLEIIRSVCDVREDWVAEIEHGLTFVANALAEERQFIQSNGEIVPIEKVKRVSKDSVEHLSRHSNLITKMPKAGEDLIPDKLYTVERLSDYTVYENKFLYMLLVFLRDFVSYRYEKITDYTYTYDGRVSLKKNIVFRKQNMSFELSVKDERKNDAFLKEITPLKDIIGRIEQILSDISFYLNTPLMQEVAKAPIIKPPITKTNVLRMNKNFKGAVELYEFVKAYTEDGYTVRTESSRVNPFSERVADEFAELAAYSGFLAYEYNLNIREHLKSRYEEEEQRIKDEARRKFEEQIKNLKKRMREEGVTPEEYILMLEKRIRMLEEDSRKLEEATAKIEELENEKTELEKTVEERDATVAKLVEMVSELSTSREDEIAKLEEKHREELSQKDRERAEAVSNAELEAERRISQINESFNAERAEFDGKIAEAKDECARQIAEAKADCETQIAEIKADCDSAKDAFESEKAELIEKANGLEYEKRALRDEITLVNGRLNAVRIQSGMLRDGEEYSDEESFEQIERQYEAFTAFYKQQWKAAKKRLRKSSLSFDSVKKNASEQRRSKKGADKKDGNGEN